MAVVAFGGVRQYVAVRLYPPVVVRQAREGVSMVGVDGDGFYF
jgi:hypothetical protein